jgi:hypothetical protein
MSKRHDLMRRDRVSGAMLGLMLAVGAVPTTASAGVVTFMWNPAGASVPLGGAGSAFTANGIAGGHYLWSRQPLTTISPQTPYLVDFIEQITGLTLNGVPVATPGLNDTPGAAGSYGLYLQMQANVLFVGPPNTYQYNSLQMSLKADPGNNDGAVSSTLAGGVGFAKGTAGDITLASGSLISGSFKFGNPGSDIRSIGHFKESFLPAAGEGGFFVTPVSPNTVLEEVLTTFITTPPQIVVSPDPSNPNFTITTLNGGTAAIDLRVPEPASVVLLGSALGLLLVARHRRS